ncbi:MAG: Ppx/GppA family phosphatase [Alphaproteobacteria bacterium]|nr:Ppx/GppA family phosphatase [Alphaproteobacteria bacterium]
MTRRFTISVAREGLLAVDKPLSAGGPVGGGAASPQRQAAPDPTGAGGRCVGAGLHADGPLAPTIASATPPRPAAHHFASHYAALDLGTNNCRLLVARRVGSGFRIVDAFSRIIRLGEGLAATGALSEDAMSRALEALRVCANKVIARKVAVGRYVATQACRQAANCDLFLARVREEVGLEIEIISSNEEARLVVAGCAPLLNPRYPYAVVFDIGGGSTEIVWLRLWAGLGRRHRPQILGSVSLPFGVVTLTDRFGGVEVSAATYRAMVTETMAALAPFETAHEILRRVRTGRVQMLGSSGTVTTLAGIHLALPRYTRALVDGSVLTFEQISVVSAHLAGLDLAGRAANPCIGRERADLVLSGCAILDAICETWPVGSLRVADRGVREGILFDLMRP